MSFYVTLPSDSSLRFFPDNKVSHFITYLPVPIDLNGEWEVGLSEIIYPHAWHNINESNNAFYYDVGDGKLKKNIIDVGFYESAHDIVSAIQVLLPKTPRFTLTYNKASKRVKINAEQGALHLEKLGSVLGFPQNTIIRKSVKSEVEANALSAFTFFYVYTDIVAPQIVGDIQAPLLRIVRVKGQTGEVISQYYDRPQYLPLMRHSFQTIQIELRLNSGNFVPFQRGKVIVILHFRMRQIL